MEANSPSKTRGSAHSRVYLSGPAAAQHVRCVGLGVGPAQDEERLPHWNNTVQLFFAIEFSAVKAESDAQHVPRLPPKAPAHQLPPPHPHSSRGDDWGRGGAMERGAPDRGGGGYFSSQPPHADVGPYGGGGGGGGYFPPAMSGAAGTLPMAGGGGGGSILARYGMGGGSGAGGPGYGQPPPALGGAGGYGQAAPPVGSYGLAPPPVGGGGYGHAPPHFGGGGFGDGQDMRGAEWGYR